MTCGVITLHPVTCAQQKSNGIRAPLWLQKRLTKLKSVPLMLERNDFGCIVFERLGRPIIFICGDTFIPCHFVYI